MLNQALGNLMNLTVPNTGELGVANKFAPGLFRCFTYMDGGSLTDAGEASWTRSRQA